MRSSSAQRSSLNGLHAGSSASGGGITGRLSARACRPNDGVAVPVRGSYVAVLSRHIKLSPVVVGSGPRGSAAGRQYDGRPTVLSQR